MDATASLFSKAQYDAPKEDIALGIIVMVLQTIGSAAFLSSLNSGIKDFVLIGNLTLLPQCKDIYPMLEKLYGVHFHIPKHSEFCTAIGAALSFTSSCQSSAGICRWCNFNLCNRRPVARLSASPRSL